MENAKNSTKKKIILTYLHNENCVPMPNRPIFPRYDHVWLNLLKLALVIGIQSVLGQKKKMMKTNIESSNYALALKQ